MNEILKMANEAFHRKIAPLETRYSGGDFKVLRPGVIEGHWHEDGNTYEITCPPQLQDSIMTLLNNCGKLYFTEASREGGGA